MRLPLLSLLAVAGLAVVAMLFFGGPPEPVHQATALRPEPNPSHSQTAELAPTVHLDPALRVEVEGESTSSSSPSKVGTEPAVSPPTPTASGWDSFEPEKAKELYPLPWDNWVGELPGVPSFVYEDKYSGFDNDDLTLAHGEVQANFLINVTKAFSDLEAQGLATRHILQVEVDEQGNKVPIGLDLQIQGACPLHKITATRGDQGEYIRDFYWLNPDDPAYEALYLIQDEMWWLQGKVSQAHATHQD